ncbi:unnamed protein product [Linum trigynum]|uniref:Retrotransposon gag domain-containing protein n=1 Tax=Linum trigynum TaxID=586398 RepID=A0AAV2CRM6_9ROSI
MMEENRKATEENRQMMAESRRLIEEARAMAHQVNSQVDCLNSRVDRRLAQLFELVNKNTNDLGEFRQLLNRPVLQTRALSSDGRDFSNLESENINLPSNGGGRGEQPRPVNPTPPVVATVATPQRLNVGVSHATSSQIHVEQPPPVQGVARQNISEAIPYMAPVNVGFGLGPNNVDLVPPRGYPQPIPPPMNMQGVDPGGFIPLGGHQGGHDVNTLRDQMAQLLAEQFGFGMRPTMPPVYRKPYPEWVDRMYPFPRGFRVPEFVPFTGTGDQSTVEHVGQFTVQCGDVGDFVKLRLFGNSLTGPAFAWYVNLPSNSVQTWQQMEQMFHAQFYRSEPEVTMADLARMRQQPGETVEHFLTSFKNARNRCFVNLTEREFVKLAQGGLNFELRKKFQDREFSDLFQLMSCAVRYETLLREEENRSSASRGVYHPNFDYAINHVAQDVDGVEVDLAEIVQGKPYVCASLAKVDNEQLVGKPNRAPVQHRKFSFDVSKLDLIFDQLYKDGQIKLSGGHSIPPPEKLKGKRYCKWHNSMSHATNSCVVFRNVLQDAIHKGRIRFPDPKKDAMTVDTDPFPNVVSINMVNPDFSKIDLPRFKLVLDTTPQPSGNSNVIVQGGSSSTGMQDGPRIDLADEEKLCAQCKGKLNLGEGRPTQPVRQRLGPQRPFKPRYPPYERHVEGVRAPAWGRGQRRQWVAQNAPPFTSAPFKSAPFGLSLPARSSPPVRRTFKMPNVPSSGWHTYDVRRQQPIALDGMTRTQYRRFLRKNAQQKRTYNMHTNVRVNNSATTSLRVTVSDSGKNAEKKEEAPTDDGYDAEMDESFIKEEMMELEHPRSKFDRNSKDDEDDDHNTSTTIQFGSLPPVVVNNYILPMIFHFEVDGERGDVGIEAEDEEVDEASHEQAIAELNGGFAELDLDEEDEEPQLLNW